MGSIIENVNEDNLREYRRVIYKVLTIILKINQKVVSNNEIDDDDNLHMQNAYVDLEEDINMDVINRMPQEVKDNLISVNFYLNSVEFDSNKFNVVKEVINSLYSTFEFILKQVINSLVIDANEIITKDEVLKKIREEIEVGESLYRVSPKMIEYAFQKQGASLGAYMLVYLYYHENIDVTDVKLVETILTLRGHGSPSMEDVEKINKIKLTELKKDSFVYMEKLMEKV